MRDVTKLAPIGQALASPTDSDPTAPSPRRRRSAVLDILESEAYFECDFGNEREWRRLGATSKGGFLSADFPENWALNSVRARTHAGDVRLASTYTQMDAAADFRRWSAYLKPVDPKSAWQHAQVDKKEEGASIENVFAYSLDSREASIP